MSAVCPSLTGDLTCICFGPPDSVFLVVGAFHSQDQSGGHQQASQQGPGFGRQPQAFYNSRGMSRGGPRNARGMINGYRGSSNGFRGELTACFHIQTCNMKHRWLHLSKVKAFCHSDIGVSNITALFRCNGIGGIDE